MDTGIRRIRKLRGRGSLRNSLASAPYYQWRSDHELILLRVKVNQGASSMPDGDYANGVGFYAVELNLRTGKEKPLAELNKQYFGQNYRMIGYWLLSPDLKWLFWPEWKRPKPTWFVASLDGTHGLRWTQPAGDAVGAETPYYAWTPDSHRWVALVRQFEQRRPILKDHLDAVIGSLDAPGVVHEIKNIHTGPGDSFPGFALLGITPENRAVTALWASGQDTPVDLFTFSVDAKHPSPRDLTVRLPGGTRVRDVVLSPKGDRLGWVLFSDNSPDKDELWVSRLDGTGMHRVGAVSSKPPFPMADEQHPEGLAWTPDGRQISFIHKGALCVVRVE